MINEEIVQMFLAEKEKHPTLSKIELIELMKLKALMDANSINGR